MKRVILGIVIGILISGAVYAAATIASDKVSYDNTSSKSSATNVQGAIDDLYNMANNLNDLYILWGYASSHGNWTLSENDAGNYTMTLNNWTGYNPYLWVGVMADFTNYNKLTFKTSSPTRSSNLYYIVSNLSYGMAIIGESGATTSLPPTGTSIGSITTNETIHEIDLKDINGKKFLIIEAYSINGMGSLNFYDFNLS